MTYRGIEVIYKDYISEKGKKSRMWEARLDSKRYGSAATIEALELSPELLKVNAIETIDALLAIKEQGIAS